MLLTKPFTNLFLACRKCKVLYVAAELPEIFVVAEKENGDVVGILRNKESKRFKEVKGVELNFKERKFKESDAIKVVTKEGNEIEFSDFETLAFGYPSPNGAIVGSYEVEVEGKILESEALKEIGGSHKATFISVGKDFMFVKKYDLVIVEPFKNVYPYLRTFDGAETDIYIGDEGLGVIIGRSGNIPIVKLGRYGVHIVGWLHKNKQFEIGKPDKVFLTRTSLVYVDEMETGVLFSIADITPPLPKPLMR